MLSQYGTLACLWHKYHTKTCRHKLQRQSFLATLLQSAGSHDARPVLLTRAPAFVYQGMTNQPCHCRAGGLQQPQGTGDCLQRVRAKERGAIYRALVASQTSTTLKTLTTGYKATSKVTSYGDRCQWELYVLQNGMYYDSLLTFQSMK